jgi:hypothetical protein
VVELDASEVAFSLCDGLADLTAGLGAAEGGESGYGQLSFGRSGSWLIALLFEG